MFRQILGNCCHRLSRRKLHVLLFLTAVLALAWFNRRLHYPDTASKYSFYLRIFGEQYLPEPFQSDIDYFAEHVQVNYTVVDNCASGESMRQYGGYFLATLTFLNTGNDVVGAKRWHVYGFFMQILEHDLYPYPLGFFIKDCGLKVFHVGGSLYRFEPVGNFYSELKPNDILTCKFKVRRFQVSRTDSMPNWYVTGSDTVPKTIVNTKDEALSYVSDFTSEGQYKRRKDDRDIPYSTKNRYESFKSSKETNTMDSSVLPTPLEFKKDNTQTLDWDTDKWYLLKNDAFKVEIKYLSDIFKLKIVASKPSRKYIHFIRAPVVVKLNNKKQEPDEAYSIKTDPAKNIISITAKTSVGAFYAIQTLRSIVFAPEALTGVGILITIPSFTITDAPRYTYRGLHIDVARNFHSKEQIMKVMEAMAMYKMNKLHLHLSDDEGWRLEIPGLPELTFIGARRCHDLQEEQCIMPMLGSGPDLNTSGSGHYSEKDYKDMLRFAQSRHIEVIPEFDMPGHSRAAIKSIHAKSQKSHRAAMRAEAYSVIEEGDTSNYHSGQNFNDDVMNPCIQSTYTFVQKVISEVKLLHKGIQPLKTFHFGGDEVAKGAWDDSQECKRLTKEKPEISTEYDKMQYFVQNVANIASEKDLSVGVWEDGMLVHSEDNKDKGVPFPRSAFENKDIYVYVWKRPSESRTPHRTRLFANNDYKVILAYGSYLYFDHPYEPDPEERGLYWATRKISTEDVWTFTPGVAQRDVDLECPSSVPDKTDCFQMKRPQNIIGMQAELWTETVRTGEQVDAMLFPRLLAVAERAWHQASWEDSDGAMAKKEKRLDWIHFINVIGSRELRRLDNVGIKYRVPPPGAVVKNGHVMFATEFPGLDVEYFSDAQQSWLTVSHNMLITHPMKIRTRSTDKKRHSRVVVVSLSDTVSAATHMGDSTLNSLVKYISVAAWYLIVSNISAV